MDVADRNRADQSAKTAARDAFYKAVTEKAAQASGEELLHLARAYAVIVATEQPETATAGLTLIQPEEKAGGHKVGLALELEQ